MSKGTVMISQPMAGKDAKEILFQKSKAELTLQNMGYTVANTYFNTYDHDSDGSLVPTGQKPYSVGLNYLSKSLEAMSYCDTVYFCQGWEGARGCKLEHEAAKAYGLKVLYE